MTRGHVALLRLIGWNAVDRIAFLLVVVACFGILVNMLFMQSGRHPAPILIRAPQPAQPTPAAESSRPPRPIQPPSPSDSTGPSPPGRAEPVAAAKTTTAAQRMPGEVIADIQRELARRGHYDGTVDGIYGPRTDAAIRDFERAAGLKPSAEPTEALLQAILRYPIPATKAIGAAASAPRPPMPMRTDSIGEGASSRRVVALQHVLADYGYGQLKPTGVVDAETQVAIQRFEQDRRLPITGQPSERLARELTAMTGRPLE